MEEFVATILSIFDNINKENEKIKKNDTKINIINTTVEEKQYLAYYIYRIWIKYRTLIEYTNGITEFNKVLTSFNLPVKYFKYRVTFPMQNKMVNNEKQLDLIILMILKQFNKCHQFFTSQSIPINNDTKLDLDTPQGQYKIIIELLTKKNLKTIISDINNIKILVPNLSKGSSRIELWSNSTPFITNDKSN